MLHWGEEFICARGTVRGIDRTQNEDKQIHEALWWWGGEPEGDVRGEYWRQGGGSCLGMRGIQE